MRGQIHKGNQSKKSLGGQTANLKTENKAKIVCCI